MKIIRNQAEDFVHFGEDHYSNLKILKDMKVILKKGYQLKLLKKEF